MLFAGPQSYGSSSSFRVRALRRLGCEVVTVDTTEYSVSNSLLNKVAFRLSAGPHVQRLNRDLMALVERERPAVFWADKGLLIQTRMLERMRRAGIVTVSYMIDNAFGARKDPGWRLYKKGIPYYDLHITQRDVSIQDYLDRGASNVLKVQTAFEESVHFPPPEPITDAVRDRGISFSGTPYDDRASIITRLYDDGLPVVINGPLRAWARALRPDAYAAMVKSSELWEDDYREGIWKSRINLSFLTKANQDEYTHKSFEIAGAGGFLLAERCRGHELKFKEDEEAVFFSDYDDLKAKIERYLPDEAARNRIAAAGHARAVRDGYGNDRQMAIVLDRVREIAAAQGRTL